MLIEVQTLPAGSLAINEAYASNWSLLYMFLLDLAAKH